MFNESYLEDRAAKCTSMDVQRTAQKALDT